MEYVYQFETTEALREKVEAIAKKNGLSSGEMLEKWLEWAVKNPTDFARLAKEYRESGEDMNEKFVLKRIMQMSDEEAVEYANAKHIGKIEEISEEDEARLSLLPTVTEDEFRKHCEDDDFFKEYGNPVRIIREDGRELIYESFDLYARQMKQSGQEEELARVLDSIRKYDKEHP